MTETEKCEFSEKCVYYRPDSFTCNKEPGPYCGVWRRFAGEKEVIKRWKGE